MTIFVEICAGSAAVSLHAVGLTPFLGYCGSKKRYADAILHHARLTVNEISKVHLNDPGLWGVIWSVLCAEQQLDVSQIITKNSKTESRACYVKMKRIASLNFSMPNAKRAAASLMVLAGTFGGKEVGGFKGLHKNRPNVDGFIPNRTNLAAKVNQFHLPSNITWNASCHNASDLDILTIRQSALERILVFIDPPYMGSESVYENKLPRKEVIELAYKWWKNGADVIVSEATLIKELKEWTVFDLTQYGTTTQVRKNSKSQTELLHVRLHLR